MWTTELNRSKLSIIGSNNRKCALSFIDFIVFLILSPFSESNEIIFYSGRPRYNDKSMDFILSNCIQYWGLVFLGCLKAFPKEWTTYSTDEWEKWGWGWRWGWLGGVCSNLSITIHGMILDNTLTVQLSRMTHSYRTEHIISQYVGRKGVQIPPFVKRKRR